MLPDQFDQAFLTKFAGFVLRFGAAVTESNENIAGLHRDRGFVGLAIIANSFIRTLAEGVHEKCQPAPDGVPCRAGPAQGSARSATFVVHSGHGFFVQVPLRERKGF